VCDLPYFSDQIVNGVPGNWTISDGTPPAHQVGRFYICVCMEMIRDRYFRVSEGRCNETDTELGRGCWLG
jgi:hypothetical protein